MSLVLKDRLEQRRRRARSSAERGRSPRVGVAEAFSLHARIIADLTGHIMSGRWRPGHRVPIEAELARSYGCSRMTVSKALGELARRGLIERRRRAGTVVAAPRAEAAVLEIHDIAREVAALGAVYRHEIVGRSRRRSTAEDRRILRLTRDTEVLAVECLHFAGTRPYCREERTINLDVVPAARHETFAAIAPGPWLIERVPWTEAEHRIRAEVANERTADALAIPRGSAALVVERLTWTAGRAVTHARLTYPAELRELVARFTPSMRAG